MKKLKSKVFITISLLLTIFLLSILIIFNYQDYSREYSNIRNNLDRINNDINRDINRLDDRFHEQDNNKLENRIFMDLTVYTVVLDNNNIEDIISHNEDSNIESIRDVATDILKKDKDMYIGNLYLSKYSYKVNNNYLTIIDNTNINNKLIYNLRNSIIIFIILEIIIIIVSKFITNWLVKPAIDSYNKQKEFIADASHELKTPLAVIMASADSIEGNNKDSKWINNIKNETNRMSNLITDLLDLATMDKDNNIIYSKINLSKVVEKQVLIFESLAYENNVSIEYDIDKDIEFNGDSDRIKQLISILVDNAIKHSYKKESIKVSLKKDKDIVIKVINKGKAIEKEDYDKIFERFYRVDKARNRKENRYGLGLAIAKSIVTNHNGTISVESNGGYTTFKVVFK